MACIANFGHYTHFRLLVSIVKKLNIYSPISKVRRIALPTIEILKPYVCPNRTFRIVKTP